MRCVQTSSGSLIAVGMEFDSSVSRAERRAIEEREAAYAARQRALPRKRKPDYMKAGPLTWIQP